MKEQFLNHLKWRGLLNDASQGVEDHLIKGKRKAYIGFDPTAPSLTIGNLVQIILLKHFQDAGHSPIILMGGGTGMVGDPSGKSEERSMIDKHELVENLARVEKQFRKLLHFDTQKKNDASIINNASWLLKLNFIDFIRDVGKHVPINYMLAKDSIKSRMEKGISFTEFCYQLVQAYDFFYLCKHENCTIQMGGSDQWGNIVSGIDLIHRLSSKQAYAITSPLLTKKDGSKFGKSLAGNIWLDEKMTSCFQFYQFWINQSDQEALKLIKIFSFLEKQAIEALCHQHLQAPEKRIIQHQIAKEMTTWVHGDKKFINAQKTASLLFKDGDISFLSTLDFQEIKNNLKGIPIFSIKKEACSISELLVEKTNIFSSKGALRRLIAQNGLKVNNILIQDAQYVIGDKDWIKNKLLLLKKGKKNFYLIISI